MTTIHGWNRALADAETALGYDHPEAVMAMARDTMERWHSEMNIEALYGDIT